MADVDVTEIDELDVFKMSAVAQPAHSTPWLVMKSVGPKTVVNHYITEKEPEVAKVKKSKTKKAIEKALNVALYSDKATKSDSAEADAILALVTGEGAGRHPDTGQFVAAKKILTSPESNADERNVAASILKQGNRGDVEPTVTRTVDANNIGAILDRAEKALADPSCTPQQREELGNAVTLLKLKDAATSHETLMKGAAAIEALAAADAARAAQATATGNKREGRVSLGAQPDPSGASSEAQVRLIGTGEGTPQALAPAGKIEPDALREIGRKIDELGKAVDPLVKDRLGLEISHARLRAAHEAGQI